MNKNPAFIIVMLVIDSFILMSNSIKEQKIAFFYEYPELVQSRENILNEVCYAVQ